MLGAPGGASLPFSMSVLRWNLYRKIAREEKNKFRRFWRMGLLLSAQIAVGAVSWWLQRRFFKIDEPLQAFVLGAAVLYTAAMLWVSRRDPGPQLPNGKLSSGDFVPAVLLAAAWVIGLIPIL